MRDTDMPAFAELLDTVCLLLSRGAYTHNETNTALWFRALSKHSLGTVRSAFDAHVRDPQRGRFVPTPADVIAQIGGGAADDERPGPEEAWAIALGAADEHNTVVWTDEIARAWQIAKPVFRLGDEVGARMAFREAYTRLVGQSKGRQEPAAWAASLGWNKATQVEAIANAVEVGRLPHSALLAVAPNPGSITMLLEVGRSSPSPLARKAVERIRAWASEQHRAEEEILLDTTERDRMNEIKVELAEKLHRNGVAE